MTQILLTTTSFQDTPGEHHKVLEDAGYKVVTARGPLTEDQLFELLNEHGGFDGLLNGDDAITAKFIDAALAGEPKLKVIAKYGIGLDSIDVEHATNNKIPVLFTPGVNDVTVAEQAIGMMIAIAKHFYPHMHDVKEGKWNRRTGMELFGKTIGIVGLGRIGKQIVKRCNAFGMKAIAYDPYFDEQFAKEHHVEKKELEDLLKESDIVTLHTGANEQTIGMINKDTLALMKEGSILIDTARGTLIVEEDVAQACKSGHLRGYAGDVLVHEPIQTPHIFQGIDNIIITPHISSRTNESVQRQGVRAAKNIVNFLEGREDYIQANKF